MKYVANEDATIEASADTITISGVTTPGGQSPNGSFATVLSNKNLANNKKVLLTNISWIPLNCTLASHTWVSGVSTGINATSNKCFDTESGSKSIVLEGDSGTCTGSFTLTASPFTVAVCKCNLEVTSAGQIKVSAI